MSDATAPTPGAPPAGPPPAAPPSTPPAATRPDWLPETHWDGEQSAIKPEFGAHYSELATFHKTQTEARAALESRKADDIKIELKLPETVKVPDGLQLKIDEKDPRIPVLRDLALKRGLDQDTINDLIALDATMQIAAHTTEMERVAAEDKKLGDTGKTRKEAVSNWIKTLGVTTEEAGELRMTATTAAGVTALEKLMQKVAGAVPGAGNGTQQTHQPAAEQPIEQRWYGTSQQKAS